MLLQLLASVAALLAFILAFMVATGLPAFATLLGIGLLGVFLCRPRSVSRSCNKECLSV